MKTTAVARRANVASGQVCIAGTGIIVEAIAGRFAAGEDLYDIANDYGLPISVVTSAVRVVMSCAFTSRGLRAVVVHAMERQVPLEGAA